MKKIFSTFLYIFEPFKYKNFIYFLAGAFLSNLGSWIQQMALSWYFVEKLNSSFYLGMINFIIMFPVIIFAPVGGLLADRINRKVLIIISNIVLAIAAVILGFVVLFENKNIVLVIIIISLIFGIGNALSMPSWQSYITQIIEKKVLLNAISLNSAQFHLARFLGPSLAAMIISKAGLSWCFYVNGISFLAVVLGLVLIKNELSKQVFLKNNNKWYDDIIEGLKYIKNKKNLVILLSTSGVISFFGISYMVLSAIYVKNIFYGDVKILGILMSSAGLGAFIGAMIVSGLNLHFVKKQIINYSIKILSIALTFFAISKNFYFSIILIFIVALMMVMSISSINTLIQEYTQESYRGRVMSSFVLIFNGFMSFGSLGAGFFAEVVNPQMTLFLSSVVIFVWSIFLMQKWDWE